MTDPNPEAILRCGNVTEIRQSRAKKCQSDGFFAIVPLTCPKLPQMCVPLLRCLPAKTKFRPTRFHERR